MVAIWIWRVGGGKTMLGVKRMKLRRWCDNAEMELPEGEECVGKLLPLAVGSTVEEKAGS